MATVARENIGLLNDKVIIKLSKEDYMPAFEKSIKEYSRKANIPGFRKGMVPAGMVKKMYGPSLFADEILKTVEKELYLWLNQEKPEIFARPLPLPSTMNGFDMNHPAEYSFEFEMGLKPDFKLADFSKGKFNLHQVEVTDAMVQEEVDRMRIKAGKMSDREAIDHEDNVLNIVLEEADKSGNAIEAGIRKENSVLLKYLSPVIQKELMGKKTGDKICFQLSKAFEADKLEMMLHDLGFEKNDKEAAKKYFNLEVVKIGHVEKRDMDEGFFNELFPGRDLKTEKDFNDALKQEIEKYWEGQTRNQLHDQIYHFLLDETTMEFPEAFLKRWLQVGTEKEKTAEEAEMEFPTFSNQLKWTLISDRVLTENKLEVSDAELRQHMKHEVMGYFGQSMGGQEMEWLDSYVERMMKDEKQVDATYRRLITEKMFKWAEEQVKPKVKKVTPEELGAMQHHHH